MNVVLRMNISEMPTACGPCELSCTAFCKEWTKVDRKEIGHTKSPNCPIIAILPEGHGQLIDADELFHNMFVTKDGKVVPNMDCDGRHHLSMHVEDVKGYICEAPTIVPAEAERSET